MSFSGSGLNLSHIAVRAANSHHTIGNAMQDSITKKPRTSLAHSFSIWRPMMTKNTNGTAHGHQLNTNLFIFGSYSLF